MLKKIVTLIAIFQFGMLLAGSAHAGSGVNMIRTEDAQPAYQTVVRDGAVEWQGPEVTVRVVNNEVFVIKNGATIKIVDELVEVSGGEALQVRKVEQLKPTQEMGGGVDMLNGQAVQGGGVNMIPAQTVQGGGVDMNTTVTSKTVTPVTDKSFTGKFFRNLVAE